MTQDDIHAKIAEREAAAAAERKRAIVITSVMRGVVAIVALVLVIAIYQGR